MANLPLEDEVVFRAPSRETCFESRLVLEAVGIPSDMRPQAGSWVLVVPSQYVPAAFAELHAYQQDHPAETTRPASKVQTYSGAIAGIVLYAATILSVALLANLSAYGWDWNSIGVMRAGEVTSGEWWRTITALTLHADSRHLASNLLFGGLFGLMAGRIFGGGVAWLCITLGGALGNAMNAFAQSADHASIGASTAVFAALGMMVAHALRPRSFERGNRMKRWSPLIAGVLLLSFIGVGDERTDVLAHVTGFIAGLGIGWGASRLPARWLSNEFVQTGCGVAAIGLVIVAWFCAANFS
ncbi:Rhomboid family protein [Roseimaritima multifibrata]|uniref:Rhomboid family protein n=1 Tax=Roseimaritima multifibrata TaxID=1930274 RepID=A0A517MHL3_9BACT|nr:rhomboid family intramembrane serine protease [Roseimaritima multifibrata]QDS94362.1 Rhomboid family protein [Roseimaritima multifibrata]